MFQTPTPTPHPPTSESKNLQNRYVLIKYTLGMFLEHLQDF